jgi:hypothetical protein
VVEIFGEKFGPKIGRVQNGLAVWRVGMTGWPVSMRDAGWSCGRKLKYR